MLDGNMSNDELRLHMGEMTHEECMIARAAIKWANRVASESNDDIIDTHKFAIYCDVVAEMCPEQLFYEIEGEYYRRLKKLKGD